MSSATDPGARNPRQDASGGQVLPLTRLVESWVAEGIITGEQATRILARGERISGSEVRPPAGRSPLAVEALGYLGGVIIVASALLIGARLWSDIGTATRLALLGAVVIALVGLGMAVPRRLADMGSRLRSVLWLGATLALAAFLGVLAVDALDLHENDVAVLVALGTAGFAVILWSHHRVILQQVAMMVALMAAAASAIADSVATDALPGLGVWAVGAVWMILGWGGLLAPRGAALALGSASMMFGAMATMLHDAGIVLAITTATTIVIIAVAFRDIILLGVGAVAALGTLPVAVNEWFPNALAAPLALLVVGLVLVGVAVWTARRRNEVHESRERDWSVGRPKTAISAAVVVLLAVTATLTIIAST